MKILFILSYLPYPSHFNGTTLINHRVLSNVPEDIEIDILSKDTRGKDVINIFKKKFPLIKNVYNFAYKEERIIKLIKLLFVYFSGMMIYNLHYESFFKKIMYKNKYDLLYVDSIWLFSEIQKTKYKTSVFLNAIDSLSNLNKSFYKNKKTLKNKIKYILYKKYEGKIFKNADLVNFVSYHDCKYIKEITHKENIINIPLGISKEMFYYNATKKRMHASLLFSGNFAYKPNADAAKYIIETICPELSKISPNIKIYIVGKNPIIIAEKKENLNIIGFVNDLCEWYNKVEIFFCPLLSGAGMKYKMLEAMACGLPIIATSVSVSGIEGLIEGYHYIRADTKDEQMFAIKKLLNDNDLKNTLSVNAIDYINNYPSWDVICEKYYDSMRSLVQK
jgi:glycosyltransferase involved in cell wall biosynthesis